MMRSRSTYATATAFLLAAGALALVPHASASGVGATFTTLAELPFDDNRKLSTHLLLYPDGPCASLVEKEMSSDMPYGRELHAVSGDALTAYFGPDAIGNDKIKNAKTYKDCPVVCVERGVDHEVVGSPMPNFYYDSTTEGRSLRTWVTQACQKVEFGFVSYYPKTVNMFWVHPDTGGRQPHGQLERTERKTKFLTTFLGHRFVCEDPDTGETVLDHTVEFSGIISIGDHEHPQMHRDVDSQVQMALNNEWTRHKRVTRTFTPLGFDKGRLPDDLWGSIGAYYYNNRKHRVSEEWDGKGVFVNWWEIDVKFIQIPWELKTVWQSRLRTLVEEWTGIPLQNTDIYGLRQYEGGARLLTHVDREATHAASLIINVEQGNVTKPWTIEVHDHADRLHEVVMRPGDVVYYESAKCLHGRNTPLVGGYYVNLFAHYRPVDDAQWYRRPNPEGTPEALIDVGECKLVGELNQYSQGAVQCENAAIGPHLSPSMFTARSGEDLYQWWKSVGPQEIEEDTSSGKEEL